MAGKRRYPNDTARREADAKRKREARAAMNGEALEQHRIAKAEAERERLSRMNEAQRNALRASHAEAERERISQMSEAQRNALRAADTESHRERISQMSMTQRNAFRAAHTESERERISQMSEAQRNALRAADTESHRERISQMSITQRNAFRAAHTESERGRMSQMSEAQRNALRAADTESHRERISQMSITQRNAFRAAHTESERERISQMSETQRIAFREANAEAERRRLSQLSDTQRQNLRAANTAKKQRTAAIVAQRSLGTALYNHNDINESLVQEYSCGRFDVMCTTCLSKNFKDEQPADKKFSSCCHKGKVQLSAIRCPEIIQNLLTNRHHLSSNFLLNVRKFNNALAFASMGAQVKPPPGHGPYCFRVHGQVYHQSGPLHPINGEGRKFAQIYILDPSEALDQRMNILANTGCNQELMNTLGQLIQDINPFAQAYKMMREVELEEANKALAEGRQIHDISMAIVTDRYTDERRYNLPRVNEVAIVFNTADGAPPFHRDIRVNLRGQFRTERISVLHPGLDPMTYPILYPYGDEGWKPNTKQVSGRGNVTQLQHYAYRLAVRDEFSPILNAGKLTQQYCVDSYCKIEANRLNFIQQNQKNLRVEKYSVLDNHAKVAGERGMQAGKQFILPSSFQGSPRAMNQHYQDAMAIVRRYGKPDLFITMTCNPKWKEITENLEPWQRVEYRPDLVARVFRLKLKELLHDLSNRHVLGVDIAKVHVIEFQKRGLPHAHILVILSDQFKPKTKEIVDKMISAEIPDPVKQPRLHAIVLKQMIHGPCGAINPASPCMVNGECTKKFPKGWANSTNPNLKGYPIYTRRKTGLTYSVGTKLVDNSWVVPYNPYLLLKYNCHINTEVCASVQSVKYLFQYVYKGHDCATIEVRRADGKGGLDHNEIESFIDSRYVSAPEAIWRIFEFRMHEQSHFIQKLCIHLPNEQQVYFEEGDEVEALARNDGKDDTLTAWFKLNVLDPNARQYLYTDIPEHYTFVQKDRIWKIRKQGHEKTIGRMYNVAISQGELFYLRLLLLHVRGPTSFDDLKTFEGTLSPTFKQAAINRHLLEDDTEWDNCIAEAAISKMPRQLRQLFAIICVYCEPISPLTLWEKYKAQFIEDFIHHGIDEVHAEHYALQDIQVTLTANSRYLKNYDLPDPPNTLPPIQNLNDGTDFDQELGRELVEKLNPMQKAAFYTIMNAVLDPYSAERLFFLDGPGGSGKTFTYETLYHTITGLALQVKCCASTGIAANLLPLGRTYHSTFGLGPAFDSTTVSSITIHTPAGKALKDTAIIVWDEITMTPFYALDVIDRLLRDLTQDSRPFGGKVILLGGDFRQCLPVVKRGNRVRIVESCIQSSALWHKFVPLKLSTNMRVSDINQSKFREWLLKLGDGELTNAEGLPEDVIEIPEEFIEHDSLLDSIFGEKILPEQVQEFQNKAILCPTNEYVHKLNNDLLGRLEGECKTYSSVDSIVPQENVNPLDYPTEFLNSQTPGGTPPHNLNLKIGAIIMLLRNLNSTRGLCNGTRLTVVAMQSNLILAKVLSGKAKGQTVFIPRIDIIPTDTDLPFDLKRRQFPIMLAFVMSINKSQGQSLDSVGIYLPSPVFSHGQLYVAFSRGRSKDNIKVQVLDTQTQGRLISGSPRVFTKNVVYKEVFDRSYFLQEQLEEQLFLDECEDLMLVNEFDNLMADLDLGPIPVTDQISCSTTPDTDTDSLFGIEFEPDADQTMPWYRGVNDHFDIHGRVIQRN